MKIPLTVSEDYCSSWGLFEGVREFMQNGRDATRAGCTFDAFYSEKDHQVRLITKGALLEHRTLLLGKSTKRGRADMLGQQGEGYKIGSLVLLRLGKRVKIRTGSEVWQPEIAYSKQFDENVIVFDIQGGRKHRDEVVVEIHGVTPEEWGPIKERFLALDEHDFEIVESPAGSVLIDGAGHIYVDTLWVCQDKELRHGYNFHPSDVDLDRDRRLVESFKARTLAARVWESLYLNINGAYCDLVDGMLADDVPDVEHFRYDWCVGTKTREKIADRFREKHGQSAIPVQTESEARELEFFGRKGEVVASRTLRDIVERKIGTLNTVKHQLAREVQKEFAAVDLDPAEAKNLLLATTFIQKATSTPLPPVSVVEFRDPRIMGMRKDGAILLGRAAVADPIEAIKTVVEEVAHIAGADGTHSHVEEIHRIYAAGVVNLITTKPPGASD